MDPLTKTRIDHLLDKAEDDLRTIHQSCDDDWYHEAIQESSQQIIDVLNQIRTVIDEEKPC